MLRRASGTLSTSALVLLMVAAANVLIARTLGVNGQGGVAASTLIPTIVAYAGECGIPAATGYLINQRGNDRLATIANARAISGIVAVILVCLSATLSFVLPLPSEWQSLSIVYSLFPAVTLYYRLHLAVLQADLRIAAFNWIRLAGAAMYVGSLAVLALTDSATVLGVVIALLLGNVIVCAAAARAVFRRPGWRLDRAITREILGFGLRAHAGNVSSVDALKLDQLILALFLTTRELGLYVAAATVIIGNRLIGVSLGVLCFPLATRQQNDDNSSAPRQFRQLVLAVLALSVPLVLIEVVAGERILVILFGSDFSAAAPAFKVLALGSIFSNLRQVCAEWLRGSGRPAIVAVSELVAISTSLIGAALLWDGSIVRVAWIVSASAVAGFLWLPLGVAWAGRKKHATLEEPRDGQGDK